MKDEVNKEIRRDGNAWIYIIIICIITLILVNKCDSVTDIPESTNIENSK